MSVRDKIEREIRTVAKEQGRHLAPLHDDLSLRDTGLDSLCVAILVVRLEEEFEVDPLSEVELDDVPKTLGEFIQLYIAALSNEGPSELAPLRTD